MVKADKQTLFKNRETKKQRDMNDHYLALLATPTRGKMVDKHSHTTHILPYAICLLAGWLAVVTKVTGYDVGSMCVG